MCLEGVGTIGGHHFGAPGHDVPTYRCSANLTDEMPDPQKRSSATPLAVVAKPAIERPCAPGRRLGIRPYWRCPRRYRPRRRYRGPCERPALAGRWRRGPADAVRPGHPCLPSRCRTWPTGVDDPGIGHVLSSFLSALRGNVTVPNGPVTKSLPNVAGRPAALATALPSRPDLLSRLRPWDLLC